MKKFYEFQISAAVEGDTDDAVEETADDIMEKICLAVCQGVEVDGEHECRYTDWAASHSEIDEEEQ